MKDEAAAMDLVFLEHDALCRESNEFGQPVHECPHDIDAACPFVWDRGHALGIRFYDCSCPACRR